MKYRVVNMRHERCDLRIDRQSVWGNLFKVGTDGTREEVIEKFRAWLKDRPHLIPLLRQACMNVAAVKGLDEIRLGCWCVPLNCHGIVLVEMLAALTVEEARDE